jgi:ATP-binding protein involved in chromosome partitioning
MSLTETAIVDALRPVQDPELHRSIVDLGMVRDVVAIKTNVALTIVLTIPGCPLKNEISSRVTTALTEIGATGVDITWGAMTDEERAGLRELLHGDPAATAGSQPAHGHAEGRTIPFADPSSKTRVLLIASGKGGVGKSSVTTNLAVTLAARGKRVAIVDADVWGFSIPKMLGVDRPPVLIDQMIVPPVVHGVACISMGFFAEEDQAVIWRGPMLHKALEQFLTDVFWDEPDYLLVDLPPGTGDISISLAQFLPRAELYVVTTPQPAAQRVAQRAASMAVKVNLTVKGVIENMSWFTGDDGKRYELFGAGGGQELADRIEVPLLGQVPLLSALREGSDTGNPIVVSDPDGEAAVRIQGDRRTDRRRTGTHATVQQGTAHHVTPSSARRREPRRRESPTLSPFVASLRGVVVARPQAAVRHRQGRRRQDLGRLALGHAARRAAASAPSSARSTPRATSPTSTGSDRSRSTPTEVKPNLFAMAMDTEESLKEYLRLQLKVPLLAEGRAAGPHVRLHRERRAGRQGDPHGRQAHLRGARGNYDLVVVDASATGHVVGQLASPVAINDLVKVGWSATRPTG